MHIIFRPKFFLALFLSVAAVAECRAETRPELFFYPPVYQLSDGRPLNSPQTVSIEQITTKFPAIPEMTGVVLMVYWSTLCPDENRCDLSILDATIRYWSTRGKKVILSVATIGYPMVAIKDGKLIIASATPEWVMNNVKSYRLPARVLGLPVGSPAQDTAFPDFRDDMFVNLVSGIVQKLAKYDGNPAISTIRIGTGLMGEDNPLVGPVSAPMKGYEEHQWLEYCDRITRLYRRTIHRTRLEFDISRLSWMYSVGNESDKRGVSGFVEGLLHAGIVLAFDGLDSGSQRFVHDGADSKIGMSASFRFLKTFRQKGGTTGLEALDILSANSMQDVLSIGKTVHDVSPSQIVLFSDFPAGIQRFRRENSHDSLSPDTGHQSSSAGDVVADHAAALLRDFGYQ